MEARRFRDYGMEQFESYLKQLRDNSALVPPIDLLTLPRASEPIGQSIEFEPREFATKLEAGNYLCQKLQSISVDQVRQDVGLWAWLTLFYFDAVCPVDGHSRRRLKDMPKYFSRALGGSDGLIKHLLYFPWRMVQQHGDSVDYILSEELPADSKMAREWGTRLYEALLPSKIQLGREMYWDAQNQAIRRGATSTGGRSRPGRKGNVRRLLGVLNQFELTYDLASMNSDGLAELLPENEFGSWLAYR